MFSAINLISSAQNEIGDTWHYTYSEEYGPQRIPPLLYESAKMEICSDTTINGVSYFRVCLNKEDHCNPMKDGFLFRNDSGRVYVFNLNWQKEYKLYDFNLGVGEQYSFPSETDPDSLITIQIDSVAVMEIFGTNKRIQYVSMKTPGFYDNAGSFFSLYPKQHHYLIEDIGSTVNYFMWWEGLCHKKRIYNLRCYSRQAQTYYHDTTFKNACDSSFFWQPNGVIRPKMQTVSFYPNPAQSHIFLSDLETLTSIEIKDAQGRTWLRHGEFPDNRVFIGDLQNGYYWISVTNRDGDFLSAQLLILR